MSKVDRRLALLATEACGHLLDEYVAELVVEEAIDDEVEGQIAYEQELAHHQRVLVGEHVLARVARTLRARAHHRLDDVHHQVGKLAHEEEEHDRDEHERGVARLGAVQRVRLVGVAADRAVSRR